MQLKSDAYSIGRQIKQEYNLNDDINIIKLAKIRSFEVDHYIKCCDILVKQGILKICGEHYQLINGYRAQLKALDQEIKQKYSTQSSYYFFAFIGLNIFYII